MRLLGRRDSSSLRRVSVYAARVLLLTLSWSSLTWLRTLSTILRAALQTTIDTSCIERTTYDVVTNPWQVLHTTTTYQHDAVLLKVVTFTWDVSVDFLTIRQADTSDLTHRRVWLLRGRRVHTHTDTSALGAGVQSRALTLLDERLTSLSNQLLNSWHFVSTYV